MVIEFKEFQQDLFIKSKEELNSVLEEAKRRNYTRRFNHLFGVLYKLKNDLENDGFFVQEKSPT